MTLQASIYAEFPLTFASPSRGTRHHWTTLSPVSAVPVISPGGMIPVTRRPGTPASRPGPVAITPMIPAAIPGPVAIDPDIAVPWRYRPGIDHVGWLVGDIAVHRTARNSKTAGYSNDK